MKLHILLLTILIASVFWGGAADEGSLRGLKGKKSNFFDKKERSKGSPSHQKEEQVTTTPTPEEPITAAARAEPVASAATANIDDEYIEVDVALTYSNSISTEEQRQVNLALMEALNELGIGSLTEGAAPADAVMTLDSFSMEATEEALRRRLGRYLKYIGPCSRCSGGRRERRDLKKSPSIKKSLEDKLNKILKKQGIKVKATVDDVQYFEFVRESS